MYELTKEKIEVFAKSNKIYPELARDYLSQARARLDGTLPVPWMPGSIVHRAAKFLQGYEAKQ